MKVTNISTISTISVIALTACGGNGSGGSSPLSTSPLTISDTENALRAYADTDGDGNPDGDLADVLESGTVVYARSAATAAKAFDYDADTSSLTDVTISMSEDAEVLTLTINGKDFEVDPGSSEAIDARQVRYEDASGYRDVFILTDDDFGVVSDESTGNGYAELFTAYFGDESGDVRTFFVLGAETRDEALQILETTVDFNGFAYVRIDPAVDWIDEPTSTINLDASMALTADFSNQSLSGSLTNLSINGDGFGFDVDGAIEMSETIFDVNAFEGTLNADAALVADQPGLAELTNLGTYSGAFYGPTAEEVSGVIVFEGADDEGEVFNATGGFWGSSE